MTDKAPLYFLPKLGMLAPCNPAAIKAMQAINGRVRVEIRQTRGNVRRNALYWSVLALVAPILSDKIEGDPIDENMLHRLLKDRKGLYREVALPSGEVWKDYESVAFHRMPENERAEFIDWAFNTLSKWTGIEVLALLKEAENA